MDLKVGVTVAEGLLDTIGLTLPSTKGLIGVVVVEAPTTLGRGAVRWLLVTGFTCPTTADDVLFGVAVGVTSADEEILAAVATNVAVVC